MKRSIVLAFLFVCVFILSLSHAAEAGTIYASNDSSDNIYTINTFTGAATLVGPSGRDLSYSGLAYDTSTGTMYVSDVTLPGPAWGLGTVNLATGAVTMIGDHITTVDVHGLAYDSTNDVLYGADMFPGNGCGLVTVDRVTGAATFIGLFSGAACLQIRGLAYDPGLDILYGADLTRLYTINSTTGAATLVGPHNINGVGFYIGLAFDINTRTLYASDNVVGNLYYLNTTTGAATHSGITGIEVSGLAIVPAPPTAVPTMNEWGIAVFTVFAGFGAIYFLRRKMVTA